jgi:hypothetical protein
VTSTARTYDLISALDRMIDQRKIEEIADARELIAQFCENIGPQSCRWGWRWKRWERTNPRLALMRARIEFLLEQSEKEFDEL